MLLEIELLNHIKLTKTFDELDTLTVSEELVKDTAFFHEVTLNLVGSNFLRIPFKVSIDNDDPHHRVLSEIPIWF